MIKIMIVLQLMFLFLGCTEQQQTKSVNVNLKDTLTEVTSKNTPAIIDKSFKDIVVEDFNTFWKTFRNAAILGDTLQIKNLCTFPFKYRGPSDEDPIIKISKDQFTKTFTLFLKQWDGLDLDGATEFDHIKKVIQPTEQVINGQIRIGDMVFYQKNGKWLLGFLYLNEDTLDILKKDKQ